MKTAQCRAAACSRGFFSVAWDRKARLSSLFANESLGLLGPATHGTFHGARIGGTHDLVENSVISRLRGSDGFARMDRAVHINN